VFSDRNVTWGGVFSIYLVYKVNKSINKFIEFHNDKPVGDVVTTSTLIVSLRRNPVKQSKIIVLLTSMYSWRRHSGDVQVT